MRQAFVKTLIREAEKDKRIMLLTGDLGFTVLEEFRKKFPERFINTGVAEQNLIGVSAGLASVGKIVFAYSIAAFATLRPFEFIRNDIAAHKLPVIIVGTGGGLGYSHAQLTHHALEDIGLMRLIPEMQVICPADSYEVSWSVKETIKQGKPAYLRLGKSGEPVIYNKKPKLKLGRGEILAKGKDVCLIATGNIVYNALQTAKILKQKGILPTVISMHTIKPVNKKWLKKTIGRYRLLVSVEEHFLNCGLGSAIFEIASEEKTHPHLLKIGVDDCFVKQIGTHDYLRQELELTPEKMAQKIMQSLKRK